MSTSTFKPIDLNAPGALDDLFAYHRSTFGNTRMEEGAPPPPESITIPVPTAPVLDANNPQVQAFMEQARQQEKSKLYDTIEGLKAKVGGVDALQQTVEALKAEQDAKIAEARKAAATEAEESARKKWEESDAKTLIAEKDKEWGERFAALQNEREQERETLLKETQFAQLRADTQTLVSEALNNNQIAPELAHLVAGNNAEEVRASLESVKAASEAIAASVAATMQNTAPQPPAPRGVAPTGYAPVGPMDTVEQTRTLSPDQIRNMPMSEWAKIRNNIPGVNRGSSDRGLFS